MSTSNLSKTFSDNEVKVTLLHFLENTFGSDEAQALLHHFIKSNNTPDVKEIRSEKDLKNAIAELLYDVNPDDTSLGNYMEKHSDTLHRDIDDSMNHQDATVAQRVEYVKRYNRAVTLERSTASDATPNQTEAVAALG